MKVYKGLDGREYPCDVRATKYIFKPSKGSRSNIQAKCGELIKNAFPCDILLEEVPVKISKSETLIIDFFIPSRNIVIEVHGQQHFEYVEFFHSSPAGFKKAVERDQRKEDWCRLNDIDYYAVSSVEELKELL